MDFLGKCSEGRSFSWAKSPKTYLKKKNLASTCFCCISVIVTYSHAVGPGLIISSHFFWVETPMSFQRNLPPLFPIPKKGRAFCKKAAAGDPTVVVRTGRATESAATAAGHRCRLLALGGLCPMSMQQKTTSIHIYIYIPSLKVEQPIKFST